MIKYTPPLTDRIVKLLLNNFKTMPYKSKFGLTFQISLDTPESMNLAAYILYDEWKDQQFLLGAKKWDASNELSSLLPLHQFFNWFFDKYKKEDLYKNNLTIEYQELLEFIKCIGSDNYESIATTKLVVKFVNKCIFDEVTKTAIIDQHLLQQKPNMALSIEDRVTAIEYQLNKVSDRLELVTDSLTNFMSAISDLGIKNVNPGQ